MSRPKGSKNKPKTTETESKIEVSKSEALEEIRKETPTAETHTA